MGNDILMQQVTVFGWLLQKIQKKWDPLVLLVYFAIPFLEPAFCFPV